MIKPFFQTIPLELHLIVASFLPISSLNALIQTSSEFHWLLNPVLYKTVPPSFRRLSPKLVLQIGSYLNFADLNGLVCTTRKVHSLLNPVLYELDFAPWVLPWAAAKKAWHLLTYALSRGVDPATKGPYTWDALHWCAKHGHEASISALIDAGVDVDNMKGGSTALHIAVSCGRLGAARVLLDRGANVNAKCEDGSAPLHNVFMRGQSEIVELLVERGAEIDAEFGEERVTPLMLAARCGDWDSAKLLLKHGAGAGRTWPQGSLPGRWDYPVYYENRKRPGLTVEELAVTFGVDLSGVLVELSC